MSRINVCPACNARKNGVKSRVAFEHTCGKTPFTMSDFEQGLMLLGLVTPINEVEEFKKRLLDEHEVTTAPAEPNINRRLTRQDIIEAQKKMLNCGGLYIDPVWQPMIPLKLVLKYHWYDRIASGRKRVEFREAKPHWIKRLEGKQYTHVIFYKGYTAETMVFEIEKIQRRKMKVRDFYAISLGCEVLYRPASREGVL